jgi:hypothetical protein
LQEIVVVENREMQLFYSRLIYDCLSYDKALSEAEKHAVMQ